MDKRFIKNLARALFDATRSKKRREIDQIVKRALYVLRSKRLMSKKAELLNELDRIRLKKEKKVKAMITSAKRLTASERSVAKSYLKRTYKKRIELDEDIDASLLGGIKIRVDDTVVDMTLQNQLKKLTTQLSN